MSPPEAEDNQAGHPVLAFFVFALGGPVLLCWGLLLLVIFDSHFSVFAAMVTFFYLPFYFILFGSPASIIMGLCAAISIVCYGKIRFRILLLLGLPFIAGGAAMVLGSNSKAPSITDRYGLWYTLLATIATAIIAWPAKKLCDSKPTPLLSQTEGN